MPDDFRFDVFLSHSSKDKPVVADLVGEGRMRAQKHVACERSRHSYSRPATLHLNSAGRQGIQCCHKTAIENCIMKANLLTIAILSQLSIPALAGCGRVETTVGKLKSINAETKTIVIDVGGKEESLKLTPMTKGTDKLTSLEGRKVKALSIHGKLIEIGK